MRALQVQSGVGRTGKWWGLEHFPGARPDILIFAKGIASGYPLAGIAAGDNAFEGVAAGTMVRVPPFPRQSCCWGDCSAPPLPSLLQCTQQYDFSDDSCIWPARLHQSSAPSSTHQDYCHWQTFA